MNRPGTFVVSFYFYCAFVSNIPPGQPQQQRPPNLAPAPGMGPFRGPPYPGAYALPPRNVMPPYPGMPSHRTQNMLPQPSPGFIPPRGTTAFPFGATSLQQQQQQQQQQQAQAQQQAQQQQQQPQQQPPNTIQQAQQSQQPQSLLNPNLHSQQPSSLPQHSNSPLPPHLASQNGSATGLTTPGVSGATTSGASDAALDPNDFPALGSSASANSTNVGGSIGNGMSSSYASQAGTGISLSTATSGATAANLTREFSPDDFPALGGQVQNQLQQSSQGQSQSAQLQSQSGLNSEPSSLNGFSNQEHRRGSLLSVLQPPGLAPQMGQTNNLQSQQRMGSLGFPSEAEKRV